MNKIPAIQIYIILSKRSTLCAKIGALALYITLQHCNDSISPYCMSNANCGKRRMVLQSGLFCAIHVVKRQLVFKAVTTYQLLMDRKYFANF